MFWALGDLDSLITQRAQASCKPLSKSRRQKKDQRVTPRVVMRIIFLSIFVHFLFLVAASPTLARNSSLFASQILSLFWLQQFRAFAHIVNIMQPICYFHIAYYCEIFLGAKQATTEP